MYFFLDHFKTLGTSELTKEESCRSLLSNLMLFRLACEQLGCSVYSLYLPVTKGN